jgi:hypothetical protein
MTMNRLWHEKHKMPKNPTARQRIDWHVAHAANCACRPIPPGVVALMAADGKQPSSTRLRVTK